MYDIIDSMNDIENTVCSNDVFGVDCDSDSACLHSVHYVHVESKDGDDASAKDSCAGFCRTGKFGATGAAPNGEIDIMPIRPQRPLGT